MFKRLTIIGAAVVLVIVTTVGVAAANKGGTDRPFTADLKGQVTWEFGPYGAAPCGPYQQGGEFEDGDFSVVTHTEATGTATHMGNVEAVFRHCPTEVAYYDGHLTLTAANGDELFIEYIADASHESSFPMEVVDGTGRFDGATGSVTVHYGLEPVFTPEGPDFTTAWAWWATIDGTISY